MSRALAQALACVCLVLVAGCTTSDVLEPSAMVGQQQATTAPSPVTEAMPPAASGTLPPATAGTPGGGAVAAISTNARVQFAPVIGATVEAVTPLTERLMNRARERGIGLAPSGDPATTHMLKGYLAAISDNRATTVIYVWDVLDPAGNRLHRIQGQRRIEGGAGEGWQAVSPDIMREIGNQTIDEFATWLTAQTG
jgi:hypothetical protein